MAPHYHLYVGVDIAAKTFMATSARDPATAPKAVSFQQTEDGFSAFREQLGATGVAPEATLLVMEVTAGYWIALAIALHQPEPGRAVRSLAAPSWQDQRAGCSTARALCR